MKKLIMTIAAIVTAFSAMCATPSPRNHKKRPRPAPMIKTVAKVSYENMSPLAKEYARNHIESYKSAISYKKDEICP